MGLWQDFKNQDNKKKALYIALILIVLLLLLLGGYYAIKLFNKPAPVAPVVSDAPVIEAGTQNQIAQTINPVSLQQEISAQGSEHDVRIIAEPFVERFGSYNNQGGFDNFREIEIFMTDSLKAWVNGTYLAQLTSRMPNLNQYFAVNSKVLSSQVDELNQETGKAAMTMNVQRQEITNGAETKLYYQDAQVELQKVDGVWKVNGIFWK